MQIRRLRHVWGSKGIIGPVINVPNDVDKTVNSLPRQMDDDYAFNVHIKRHLIHKSSYLSGDIKKSTVKQWLKYLLTKPLYRNVTINEEFFQQQSGAIINKLPVEEGVDPNESIIQPIADDAENAHKLLLAKQHMLMWSEDKYLALAPGMKERPISLAYDEYAEEMSFPRIYLGEPRKFKIDKVTPYYMAKSEIRRRDRRGAKPEHVLYMAMKVVRWRLKEGLCLMFKNTGDTHKNTRDDIEDRKFIENCVEHNWAFMKSIPNSAMYRGPNKSSLRHIHDPVLLSLKVEVICIFSFDWDVQYVSNTV